MKTSRDRATKYGIVALAGIAILGWVREPEKHNFQAVPRVVFSPPPDDSNPVVSDIGEQPTTPGHESEKAARRPARAVHPIVSATSQQAVTVAGTPAAPA